MVKESKKFTRNKFWMLMPSPSNQSVIGTRWVFRNN